MHSGSQWTGSQLAVTLQAVSGLMNCDVTYMQATKYVGSHSQLAVFPKKENFSIW